MAQNLFDNNRGFGGLREYSVSEISGKIKLLIERNFSYIRVRGEISGLKIASSGHAYFSLKDKNSVLACVCWRSNFNKLKIKPEDGAEVIITGGVTTYTGNSRYQLNVLHLEPAGVGALMKLLEDRKKKLEQEGLFDNSRKKSLPFLPGAIGIVTSSSGAVIRDILHRVYDRCPVHVLVWPAPVQGDEAAGKISEAIKGFNNASAIGLPEVDVIILARGGGSIEDLWSFNEEIVVRSIYNSDIPIVSAVGHETDYSLSDFASDVRAPTPTAAAEMVLPVYQQLQTSLKEQDYYLYNAFYSKIKNSRHRLEMAAEGMKQFRSIIWNKRQYIDELSLRFDSSIKNLLREKYNALLSVNTSILHPRNTVQIKENYLQNAWRELDSGMKRVIQYKAEKTKAFYERLSSSALLREINLKWHNLAKLENQLKSSIKYCININSSRLNSAGELFDSLNYKQVLKRGFSIIKSSEDEVISTHSGLYGSSSVQIENKEGQKLYNLTHNNQEDSEK
jgi:exodeoxyribonuclease VII large subunit